MQRQSRLERKQGGRCEQHTPPAPVSVEVNLLVKQILETEGQPVGQGIEQKGTEETRGPSLDTSYPMGFEGARIVCVDQEPRQYKDAQVIAENFREGIPVIINLSQMSEPDARRLVDFASGLSQGLYGKIERVTNKVFLLSPAHVAVSGEPAIVDGEVEASFFQN